MESDKQIYGQGLGQGPGHGLGQSKYMKYTLIKHSDMIPDMTRTSKYMIYTLIQQSDTTPGHGVGQANI